MAKASCLISIAVLTIAAGSVCGAEEAKVDGKHTCIVLRGLDRADSEYATTLSAHGKVAAGCLISEVLGKEPGPMRADAASALVQAVATANPALDPQTAARAHEAVVKAIRDKAVEVRVATITALADFGDESAIPLLQSVATTDPILSLREYTALAIRRMRKRLEGRAFDFARNDQ